MSSLFLKMFAAFTGCRDIEINNHIRAMRQLIRNDPNALDIRVAIATLKNLLTTMDEDQVENAMVLACTTPSNEAEQSNIMAMPAIAQLQTQLNTLANSIRQGQPPHALYTPGPRQPSRPPSSTPRPQRSNPDFYYVPPVSGQETQSKTWTDPQTSQVKTFYWCQHCQLWTCKLEGHQQTHYTGHTSDLPCFRDKPTRKPANEINGARRRSHDNRNNPRRTSRPEYPRRGDNRRPSDRPSDRSANRSSRSFANLSQADTQAILANPDLMAAIAASIKDAPK
jgi:hypothetical protein